MFNFTKTCIRISLKFCIIAVKKSLQCLGKYDIIVGYYEQSSASVGTNVSVYKGGFNHEHKSNS